MGNFDTPISNPGAGATYMQAQARIEQRQQQQQQQQHSSSTAAAAAAQQQQQQRDDHRDNCDGGGTSRTSSYGEAWGTNRDRVIGSDQIASLD